MYNTVQIKYQNSGLNLMNNRVWSGPMKSFVFKSSARAPWMAQFFPDYVIREAFFCLTISNFIMYIINE